METLDGLNRYFCSRCNTLREGMRGTRLRRAPRVLNLHLLRFVYERETMRKRKISTGMQVPATLDMTPYFCFPRDGLAAAIAASAAGFAATNAAPGGLSASPFFPSAGPFTASAGPFSASGGPLSPSSGPLSSSAGLLSPSQFEFANACSFAQMGDQYSAFYSDSNSAYMTPPSFSPPGSPTKTGAIFFCFAYEC